MKIIDILNKMADGTLEDGFKFKYKDNIWKYYKNTNTIKVEAIEDVKEIEELNSDKILNPKDTRDKINELVRAVNELRKDK